jgi:hypothetical protein
MLLVRISAAAKPLAEQYHSSKECLTVLYKISQRKAEAMSFYHLKGFLYDSSRTLTHFMFRLAGEVDHLSFHG